jgi:3-deoxy-D-manno-octulosonic-acid transferase
MWLYHLFFPLVFLVLAPFFLRRMVRRGGVRRGLGERFSLHGPELARQLKGVERPVWIHAVSVGEMMMARVLVGELRRLRPTLDVVVTCTTSTARGVAERELADERTVVLYAPVDWLPLVRRTFRRIRPTMLVLLEQELWPAQLEEARRRGVPVWILNARLSDRSWRRMRRLRHAVGRVLRGVAVVGLQRESDRARFAQAGFPPHALVCTGSLKCDVAECGGERQGLDREVASALGWAEADPVVLAGSTHPGEEAMILEAFQDWRRRHPRVKLFLAPRHAERAGEVVRLARAAGWNVVRRSAAAPGADVAVLDTTGELRSLYPLATLVLGGKTLAAPEGRGGQNFLEAARAGRAIVLGPRVENFRALATEYAQAGALILAPDAAAALRETGRLLDDAAAREALGHRARELYRAELGVGARLAGMISSAL